MNTACYALSFAMAFTALVASSAAQTLQSKDPTRPASPWLAATAPMSAGPGAQADTEAPAPGLQIMVIGATRRLAMIDGQLINVGQTYQGAKLVAVDAQGVRLKTAGAVVQLHMTPTVRKTAYAPQAVPGASATQAELRNGEGR